MRKIFAALALCSAPLATAAQQPVAPAEAPVDTARLSLARTTIALVWPIGTLARIMNGTTEQITDNMLASMLDMRAAEMAGAIPDGKERAKAVREAGDSTMRELMAKADPHFEERFRITNRVMMESMLPIFGRIEPQLREGMARAYARKFTAEQLADVNRFFATPSGRVYAAESLALMNDPEVARMSATFMPELMKEMPAIGARLKAATAHLPPPPEPKQEVKDRRS